MRSLTLFQTVRPFVSNSSHRIVLLVLTSLSVMPVPASGLARVLRCPGTSRHSDCP
jgi:hypothetical protein